MSKKGSGPPPIQATSKPTPPPLRADEGEEEGGVLTSIDATLTDIEPDMDYLLSSAVPDGLSNPYASTEAGWMIGPQDVDPFSSMTGPNGPLSAYVGSDVDPYTNVTAQDGNSNAATGGQSVDPYQQSQTLEELWKALGGNTPDMSQALASISNISVNTAAPPADPDPSSNQQNPQTPPPDPPAPPTSPAPANTYYVDGSGNVWISDSSGHLQYFAVPFSTSGGYYVISPDASAPRGLVFTEPTDILIDPPVVTTPTTPTTLPIDQTPTEQSIPTEPTPAPAPPAPPPFPAAPTSTTPQPSNSPTSQDPPAASFGEGAAAFGEGVAEGAIVGLGLFALGTFGSAIGIGMLGYGAYKLATGGYKDVLATAGRIGANEGTADDYKALGGLVGGVFSGRMAGMMEGGPAEQGVIAYIQRTSKAANDVKAVRRLPIVDSNFKPNKSAEVAFQGVTDHVAGRLRANPQLIGDMDLLSAGEQRLSTYGKWAERITFGNAVERGMEAAARPTGLLKHVGDDRPMPLGGPDFLGAPETPFAGLKFQVTTPGQYLRNHLVNGKKGTIFGLHWGPDPQN